MSLSTLESILDQQDLRRRRRTGNGTRRLVTRRGTGRGPPSSAPPTARQRHAPAVRMVAGQRYHALAWSSAFWPSSPLTGVMPAFGWSLEHAMNGDRAEEPFTSAATSLHGERSSCLVEHVRAWLWTCYGPLKRASTSTRAATRIRRLNAWAEEGSPPRTTALTSRTAGASTTHVTCQISRTSMPRCAAAQTTVAGVQVHVRPPPQEPRPRLPHRAQGERHGQRT